MNRSSSRRPLAAFVLCVAFAVAGCGGRTPSTPTPNPTPTPTPTPSPTPTPTPQPEPPPPPPPPPPVLGIACPVNVEAQSQDGNPVAVQYVIATPSGGVQPIVVSCSPSPGSAFSVGDSTVTCTAQDAATQAATCSFNVRVTRVIPPRINATKFLAFGDSLTEGVVSLAPRLPLLTDVLVAYPTQLQAMLTARYTAQPVTITNAGIAGERATDGLNRLPVVFNTVQPEALLLMEGANDLIALGEAGIPRAVGALEQMVDYARARGAHVFLATLPPQRPGAKGANVAAFLGEFNRQVAAAAADEGAILVDVYSAFGGDTTTLIGADGLHPNAAGYRRAAETFFAAIRARLEAPAATSSP